MQSRFAALSQQRETGSRVNTLGENSRSLLGPLNKLHGWPGKPQVRTGRCTFKPIQPVLVKSLRGAIPMRLELLGPEVRTGFRHLGAKRSVGAPFAANFFIVPGRIGVGSRGYEHKPFVFIFLDTSLKACAAPGLRLTGYGAGRLCRVLCSSPVVVNLRPRVGSERPHPPY